MWNSSLTEPALDRKIESWWAHQSDNHMGTKIPLRIDVPSIFLELCCTVRYYTIPSRMKMATRTSWNDQMRTTESGRFQLITRKDKLIKSDQAEADITGIRAVTCWVDKLTERNTSGMTSLHKTGAHFVWIRLRSSYAIEKKRKKRTASWMTGTPNWNSIDRTDITGLLNIGVDLTQWWGLINAIPDPCLSGKPAQAENELKTVTSTWWVC